MGTLRLALAPDRRDAPADDREDAREDDFEPLALEALFVDDDSVFEDEDSDLVLFMVSDRERLEASIVGAETFRRGQRARASGRARRPTGRARSDARCPSPTFPDARGDEELCSAACRARRSARHTTDAPRKFPRC
jgi:hypothetical protein